MKILVFSDSHGFNQNMLSVIRNNPDASFVIHLGDGARDAFQLQSIYPSIQVQAVQGNCDWDRTLPVEKVIDIDGVRIMMCHGHTYGVKSDLRSLTAQGIIENVNIILYGHTHEASIDRSDGIDLICPGSIRRPRYFGNPTYSVIETGNGCYHIRNVEFNI